MNDDRMTKSRNRKLTRVASLDERLEQKCIDLMNYKRNMNQIWYRPLTKISRSCV